MILWSFDINIFKEQKQKQYLHSRIVTSLNKLKNHGYNELKKLWCNDSTYVNNNNFSVSPGVKFWTFFPSSEMKREQFSTIFSCYCSICFIFQYTRKRLRLNQVRKMVKSITKLAKMLARMSKIIENSHRKRKSFTKRRNLWAKCLNFCRNWLYSQNVNKTWNFKMIL